MPQQYIALFILNGAIILLIANLLGFPLARGLASRKSTEEKREAWRMAHSANTGFGVFLMVVGAILPHLTLSELNLTVLFFSLIASGYGFLIGSLLAAITSHRGLKVKGPTPNLIVLSCYAIGIIGSLIGIPIIIVGAIVSL